VRNVNGKPAESEVHSRKKCMWDSLPRSAL